MALFFGETSSRKFCPMPIGKLGATKKVRVSYDFCTYSNLTSSSKTAPTCKHHYSEDKYRGELSYTEKANWPYFTEKLYGNDICFAYYTWKMNNHAYDVTFRACKSKCVNANSTTTLQLEESTLMRCKMEPTHESNLNQKRKNVCRGTITYFNVTITPSPNFSTDYKRPTSRCELSFGKYGTIENITMRVEGCTEVTSDSGIVKERCDNVKMTTLKGDNAPNFLEKTSWYDKSTEFHTPSVYEPLVARFDGKELCVSIQQYEMAFTTKSGPHIERKGCQSACASYGSKKPAVLTYYTESVNIDNKLTTTVNKLKIYASDGMTKKESNVLVWTLIGILMLCFNK